MSMLPNQARPVCLSRFPSDLASALSALAVYIYLLLGSAGQLQQLRGALEDSGQICPPQINSLC